MVFISTSRALSIIFLACLTCSCEQEASEQLTDRPLLRPAKIVEASGSDLDPDRKFLGTIDSAQKSDLSFRVGGQLLKLEAKAGMEVKQGAVLAQLDKTQYQTDLKDAQAGYDLQKSQFEKLGTLLEKGFVSSTEFDQSKAQYEAAEAALKRSTDNLKYTQLKAPFNGIIASVSMENFQQIAPNQTVLRLIGEDFHDVRFSVPESLFGSLDRIDDPSILTALVEFNAYPNKSYSANFKEFESTPDPSTRSYTVIYTMPRISDFPVLPGMAATVTVDLTPMLKKATSKGVYVPIEAVFEENGDTLVWRVSEDMSVVKTQVLAAGVREDKILITEGLNSGELVVAAGVSYLREGQKVRSLEKEPGL